MASAVSSVGIKIIAFAAVILGVAVLAVCGWTISNTFLRLSQSHEWEAEKKNTTVWSSLEEDITESNNRLWDSMSDNFRILIQGCAGGAIVCALVQLLMSMIVLCSPSKRILGRARTWQWTNFNLTLLLLICLLVPLSYNREKDSFRGTSSFAKQMKNEVVNFYNTVTKENQSFLHFFFADLNSYYIVLGMNCVFLLILLFFSCCFTRCSCSDNYQNV